MTGHSGCILVERLIKFEEYELAEFYNNQLEVQQTNFKLSRKFKAYILNGKNKQIDSLECFKLAYDDFPNDKSVINAILSISINLKRKIETKYIRAAEESNSSQLLVLAGGAYATNGDFSSARRCNLKALFMSDDCRNPAFNQYLGLNLQDKQDTIATVTSVEKNTTVVLRNGESKVTYCIHGDRELPESPCVWHGDTHLYVRDKKNELLKGQAVGQFVSITDTFYIFDIEFYQKLFADNGFMDSLKYFQDTEVDKNAEESFNSLNRESRRSDNVKKQKEELVDNAKNENEKNIEVLKKLVNMLSSVIPYPQILCIANYAVVLNEKYLRDDIKTAAFKYGGKITVVGYITNKISGQANTPISAFANVNQSMNALVNIFFENADETYVVHPIAVYYDN